jgi:hypothetical protein
VSGDITTLTILGSETTTLTVTTNDVTIIQSGTTSSEVTILNTSAATLSVPASLQLSNNIPLELANIGSAGISNLAARADHVHPSTGMPLNGGNF